MIASTNKYIRMLIDERDKLKAVNADLVAALKGCIPYIGYLGAGDQEAKELACEVLAKAESQS